MKFDPYRKRASWLALSDDLPPQPSSCRKMPATADSLPPEIILKICSLRVGHLWLVPRYAALRGLSLVGRKWRGPAQALLHESIFIKTPSSAESLVDVGRRFKMATSTLEIIGNHHLPQELLMNVVAAVGGVREVRLRSFYALQEEILYHPSLKDLKTLVLENTLQIFPSRSPTFLHPFCLHSLTIDSLAQVPSSLIASLFLSSPSLRSLTLAVHPSCHDLIISIEASFPSIGPSLTFLSISNLPPTLLKSCSSLETLEHTGFSSNGLLEEYLQNLPEDGERLKELRTHGRDLPVGKELLRILDLPTCEGLRTLQLAGWSDIDVRRTEWWAELRKACEQRATALRLRE
ncbi:hypothetical protein T439DRAFT_351152 [Meredithblackwellia eburnea MCA 4105]